MSDSEGSAPKGKQAVERKVKSVPVRGRENRPRSRREKSVLTRKRLCDATSRLLESRSLRAVTVSDITNMASVSPATFYIYFADVEEAVLAVLEDLKGQLPDFPSLVHAIDTAAPEPGVRAMVKAYLSFWDKHYAVLRIRNLAADEGEPRFREARATMLRPMMTALEEKFKSGNGPMLGSPESPVLAVVTVLMGMLERLAAVIRLRPPGRDITRGRLIDGTVMVISTIMMTKKAG
ncbi:TetR/AcrR family transcriptional regulator [Hyphomonas sp.]|jgi:AcrR family transcriptional regulator|uniref:TetR/AcrR family transcriptional regulator n=1 Tax=Hyphomonas sp. TaxID=87 RepID=UPI0032D94E49